MSNSEFIFKQFTIQQDRTAMKVGTDGVLLGSWTTCNSAESILDIGTGTGLLALMMAQKTNANIVGIEIDTEAFQQATDNVNRSKWHDRITIINQSFQDFYQNTEQKFDLIITNPPYFSNSQKSKSPSKTAARHNDLLPFTEIVNGVIKLTHAKSCFTIILPHQQKQHFIDIAMRSNLYCNYITYVKPTPYKTVKRVLMSFSKTISELQTDTLIIEMDSRFNYSEEYISLTKEYYLKF